MSTTVTTEQPAPQTTDWRKRFNPFPSRSPLYYCMQCPACTALRKLMAEPQWALLDRYDKELEAEYATEDTYCECEHSTVGCELFDPEMHDDEGCEQCHPEPDEDFYRER